MNLPRKILLNPGPGTTTDEVKRALLVPDICPREAEFAAVVAGVRRDLLRVAGADPATHTTVLICGPGTAAMEAAALSLSVVKVKLSPKSSPPPPRTPPQTSTWPRSPVPRWASGSWTTTWTR